MKLTGESKILLGILAATATIVAIAAFAFSQPAPIYPREQLITTTTHTKGNPNSSVYLVEFSDFQCPACLAAKPITDRLIEQYKDKIVFAYRYFPLMQHPYGQKAAIAAEAASKQGKFWDMYDLLFTNQNQLSDELVASLAAQLKLDTTAFANDIKDTRTTKVVEDDTAYGNSIGIDSTPTFFLNGRKLNLNRFENLQTEVEKALQ